MTLPGVAYTLAPIGIMLAIGVLATSKIRAARSKGNQRQGLFWLVFMLASFLLLPVVFGVLDRLVA